MHWIDRFSQLRLDIVGLIAVLGEGSVTRNAQVTSLSWWSILPRLLPAPQALLDHERKKRLPTQPGTVVGAYSGTIKNEINFFADLLHGAPPPNYQVELVTVRRRDLSGKLVRSFDSKKYGYLFWTSIIACAMSIALVVLAAVFNDAFGLFAVIMLSTVSSLVGFSCHWSLGFKEPPPPITAERKGAIPRSDLVLFYPNGAMRVIRAEEAIARLYFQAEHCEYFIGDTFYRALALLATIMLMAGVVSLANADSRVQVGFAAAYVILNTVYWAASALDPSEHHWQNSYHVENRAFKLLFDQPAPERTKTDLSDIYKTSKTLQFRKRIEDYAQDWQDWWNNQPHKDHRRDPREKNFTAALWTAIFLTGTSRWLNEATHIAPVSDAWKDWLSEAEKQVHLSGNEATMAEKENAALLEMKQVRRGRLSHLKNPRLVRRPSSNDIILIPAWNFQQALTECFKRYTTETRRTDLPGDDPDDLVPALGTLSTVAEDHV